MCGFSMSGNIFGVESNKLMGEIRPNKGYYTDLTAGHKIISYLLSWQE